jgi:hypothetical protein
LADDIKIRANGHRNEPSLQYFRNQRTTPGRSSEQTLRPVNLAAFKNNYWRQFPYSLKNGIPKELAFIEIVGAIKGSATLASKLEPVSRDEYLKRRWKLASNFTKLGEREKIYSLYEHYEEIKNSNGETDDTDRVIHVMKSLQGNLELRGKVERLLDEIYVDGGSIGVNIIPRSHKISNT